MSRRDGVPARANLPLPPPGRCTCARGRARKTHTQTHIWWPPHRRCSGPSGRLGPFRMTAAYVGPGRPGPVRPGRPPEPLLLHDIAGPRRPCSPEGHFLRRVLPGPARIGPTAVGYGSGRSGHFHVTVGAPPPVVGPAGGPLSGRNVRVTRRRGGRAPRPCARRAGGRRARGRGRAARAAGGRWRRRRRRRRPCAARRRGSR